MKSYEPTCPRLAFGFAAAIMTVLTIGALVVLPSKMEPDSQAFALLEASGSTPTNPCAAVRLKCVDVAAVRESDSAPVQVSGADPKCKQQS